MRTYGILSYTILLWVSLYAYILTDKILTTAIVFAAALFICLFTRPLVRIGKEQMEVIYLHPFKKNIKLQLDSIQHAHFKVGDFKNRFFIETSERKYSIPNTHIQRCAEYMYKALYERGVDITSSGVGAIEWTR